MAVVGVAVVGVAHNYPHLWKLWKTVRRMSLTASPHHRITPRTPANTSPASTVCGCPTARLSAACLRWHIRQ